jgi:hypothetical protein
VSWSFLNLAISGTCLRMFSSGLKTFDTSLHLIKSPSQNQTATMNPVFILPIVLCVLLILTLLVTIYLTLRNFRLSPGPLSRRHHQVRRDAFPGSLPPSYFHVLQEPTQFSTHHDVPTQVHPQWYRLRHLGGTENLCVGLTHMYISGETLPRRELGGKSSGRSQ